MTHFHLNFWKIERRVERERVREKEMKKKKWRRINRYWLFNFHSLIEIYLQSGRKPLQWRHAKEIQIAFADRKCKKRSKFLFYFFTFTKGKRLF